MSTITFYLVLFLAGTKTSREIRTPEPFEWAGEMMAALVAALVAFIAALAIHQVLGDFAAPELTEMKAPGAHDTYLSWRF